jgi:hypothetical protein
MLYSDVLLEAVKSVSLVDGDVDSLSRNEKRLHAGYLKNAIARFNNNPGVSIGTEKVFVQSWHLDDLSHFARLVRESDNNLHLFDEGTETNVSRIKWNGIDGRSMQELPQRLISATISCGASNPRKYTIVNEKNFFELGPNAEIASYAVEENQGVVRVWRPVPLFLLFDRAILFPWEAKPGEALRNGEEYDPLDVQIMIPASHVPYLINLVALEIALGGKCEESLISQLKDQLGSQERDLMRNNVRDRVKFSFGNADYAANFWMTRGVI